MTLGVPLLKHFPLDLVSSCRYTPSSSLTLCYAAWRRHGTAGSWIAQGITIKSASSSSDTTPPLISAINTTSTTDTGTTVTWVTREAADSQVEYGLTTSYGSSTALATALVTAHAQTLNGLASSTVSHVQG